MKWSDDNWYFTIRATNAFDIEVLGQGWVTAGTRQEAAAKAAKMSENDCRARSLKFDSIIDLVRHKRMFLDRLFGIGFS